MLGLFLYWSFILVRPFTTIAAWSVVLTVALYPVYDWMATLVRRPPPIGGRASDLVGLLVVIGPATLLALGLIDSLRNAVNRTRFVGGVRAATIDSGENLAADRQGGLSVLGSGLHQPASGADQDRAELSRWAAACWKLPPMQAPA